ncbi:MAG: hypothetical protein V1759_01550 [bacterium]
MLTKKKDCYQPNFSLACRYDSGCPYCTQHMDKVNAEGKKEWEKEDHKPDLAPQRKGGEAGIKWR